MRWTVLRQLDLALCRALLAVTFLTGWMPGPSIVLVLGWLFAASALVGFLSVLYLAFDAPDAQAREL